MANCCAMSERLNFTHRFLAKVLAVMPGVFVGILGVYEVMVVRSIVQPVLFGAIGFAAVLTVVLIMLNKRRCGVWLLDEGCKEPSRAHNHHGVQGDSGALIRPRFQDRFLKPTVLGWMLVAFCATQFLSICINWAFGFWQNTIDMLALFVLTGVGLVSAFHSDTRRLMIWSLVVFVELIALFWTLVSVWCLVTGSSVLVFDIAGDVGLRMGYFQHRFWGVVNPNIQAAVAFTAIAFLPVIARLVRERRPQANRAPIAVLLGCLGLLQLATIVVLQSRGLLLSLTVTLFIAAWCLTPRHAWQRTGTAVVATALGVGLISAGSWCFATFHPLTDRPFEVFVQKSLVSYERIVAETNEANWALSIADISSQQEIASELATDSAAESTAGSAAESQQSKATQAQVESDGKVDARLYHTTSSGRIALWKNGLAMIAKQPWFGYGMRGAFDHFDQFFTPYWIANSVIGGNLHNMALTVALNSGVVGLMSAVVLLVMILVYCGRGLRLVAKEGVGRHIMVAVFALVVIALVMLQAVESMIFYRFMIVAPIFWTSVFALVGSLVAPRSDQS